MSDDGIAAFYAARLDEVEAVAWNAGSGTWKASDRYIDGDDIQIYDEGGHSEYQAAHIALHDPARTLRDIAAKRAILGEHASSGGMYPTCMRCARWEPGTWYGDEEDGEEPPDDMSSVSYPCRTVRHLGTEFSDHADYRPEWAPER